MSLNQLFDNGFIKPWLNVRVNDIRVDGQIIPSVYVTPYLVGPTGSNSPFTTIQSAINQAVADGHTSVSNPATVFVRSGNYLEDLIMYPYVNLNGISSNGVFIFGSMNIDITGNILIHDVSVTPNLINPGIGVTGGNTGNIFFTDCSFIADINTISPLITLNNTLANVIITNCFFVGSPTVNAIVATKGFSIIRNSLLTGNSSILVTGTSQFINLSCLVNYTTLVDGASAVYINLYSLIATDAISADALTVNNNSACIIISTTFTVNLSFKVCNGDSTGALLKFGCCSLNGNTAIAGVTPIDLPTI